MMPSRPKMMMESCAKWTIIALLLTTAFVARADTPEPDPAVSTEPPPAPLTPPSAAREADSGAFDTIQEQLHQRVTQARTYFTAGRYDAAIGELNAAYALEPNPNYLFSIAQCHRRSGRNRDALSAYQRFLQASPDTPLKVETSNYIAELTVLIKQQDTIEKENKRPLWKKRWFWGIVGSSTVATVLGLSLGLGLQDNTTRIGFRFDTGSTAGALTRTAR